MKKHGNLFGVTARPCAFRWLALVSWTMLRLERNSISICDTLIENRCEKHSLSLFAKSGLYLKSGKSTEIPPKSYASFPLGVEVELQLETEPNRKQALLRGTASDKTGERAYIYTDGEDVAGVAIIGVRSACDKDESVW